ncbi:MAG TPA: NAD-dependent epimerase/dehydratase family protein [Acidimicrobiia bacterium]|nr:NAD-dependent epimerase/dehydratase family protein [Acidimicrobiia bacterium]
MRALVTGAAGFVGSQLVDALLARGDNVLGVDCFTAYYERSAKEANLAPASTSPRFELVEADLRSAAIEPLLDGVDVVFHQAAQAGVRLSWSHGFADYVGHNVLATQRLLEAVVVGRPTARVIYASSSSVYGNQPVYPVPELALPQPCSPYGVTKLAAEHLCALYAEVAGVHTTSLRYFTVYGPRQRPDMAMHRLCEAAIGREPFPRYGDGTQIREFTYVDDVVRANLLAAAADTAPGMMCNIAGGDEITLAALIELVGELAGEPVKIDAQAAQPGDAVRNGGSIEHAAELLEWAPHIGLRAGVAAQLAWHRSGRELAP